ncbi:MAG: hypothetical protein K2X34_06090 [Hyphomonadaceae bacterium]|nr:hypothetical protein [Hyphomonadaceae bacterium]
MFALALFSFIPGVAHAQGVPDTPIENQTGALYRKCVDAQNVREALRQGRLPGAEDQNIALAMSLGFCEGYIQGFLEGDQFGRNETLDAYRPCIPETATLAQIYAVYRRYAETHPEEHHHPRAWTLYAALAQAFPCPVGRP